MLALFDADVLGQTLYFSGQIFPNGTYSLTALGHLHVPGYTADATFTLGPSGLRAESYTRVLGQTAHLIGVVDRQTGTIDLSGMIHVHFGPLTFDAHLYLNNAGYTGHIEGGVVITVPIPLIGDVTVGATWESSLSITTSGISGSGEVCAVLPVFGDVCVGASISNNALSFDIVGINFSIPLPF
jgi:hypothetical protein